MKYGIAFEIDEEGELTVLTKNEKASLPHIIAVLEEHTRERRQEFREEYRSGSHIDVGQ